MEACRHAVSKRMGVRVIQKHEARRCQSNFLAGVTKDTTAPCLSRKLPPWNAGHHTTLTTH